MLQDLYCLMPDFSQVCKYYCFQMIHLVQILTSQDLSYKKNPPAGYQMRPVDVIESLTRIVDNLTNNVYPTEYAWQADTFRVFNTAKDGHL